MLPALSPCLGLWSRCLRPVFCGSLLVAIVAMLYGARRETREHAAFELALRQVKVQPPSDVPAVSQESIDLALVLFGIEVPNTAEHPRLDLELHERGLTARAAFMSKTQVTIGPAAFSSWGLLAATLAHELEVHCHQNFFLIGMLDSLGLDGTGEAERQAYIHELRNAKRFGLGHADADLIADTMEYYYPEGRNPGPTIIIKHWLASRLLRGQSLFSRSL